MPAYIIALRERIKDSAEMAMYAKKAGAIDAGGMKLLAAYGRLETLEGEPFEGAVIAEFPSFEDAQAWHGAEEYQAARQHRLKGADYRFFIVQGV
jgi:uncharacterized protein (DUF1330 family)